MSSNLLPPSFLLLLLLFILSLTSYSLFDPIIQSSGSGIPSSLSKPPHFSLGRQIWDLYYALTTDVMGNAQDWAVTNTGTAVSSRVFTCKDSDAYVGRNGVVFTSSDYMQRYYTGLPTHTMIYYSIDLVVVDAWGSSDSFSIVFDERVVSTWKPADYVSSYGENLCGNSNKDDLRMTIFGKLAHTAPDLTLKLSLSIQSSSNVIGLGIQDVSFSIPSSTTTDTEETHICPKNKCIYPLECNMDQYESGNSCINCDNACNTCFGSGADHCYQCAEGYSYDGTNCVQCQSDCVLCTTNAACDRCKATKYLDFDGTCQGSCTSPSTAVVASIGTIGYCLSKCPTGQYMMPNFTCSGTCDLPMVVRTTASQGDFCDYICDQTLGLYLYWNGSCLSTCPYSPRVTYGVSFCDACSVASDYLYQNGTCLSTCAAGYTSNTVNGSQFCESSCTSPSYLYQNGSCTGTCQSLFSVVEDGSFLYCNYPCQSGEYLYQNQSCLGTCQSLFIARTEITYQFCTFPCADLSKFLYDDGSCQSTCPSPLVQRQEGSFKFCDQPCPSGDYLYQNDTCSSYCELYFNTGPSNGVSLCNYPCGGSQYLYMNNGSCLGTCDFPYRSTSISGFEYCLTPCAANEYLYPNDSCYSTCPSPMISSKIGSYNLCKDPPAPMNTVEEQADKTADLMNSGGKAASAGMAALSVVSPSNPSSTTAGSIKQMLEYLRYLNISRSDKLEAIFNVSGPDVADFIPDPEVLQKVKKDLVEQPLPYMFEKYRVHSSFIINFGDKIVLLLILTTALGGLMFLEYSGKWIRNAPMLKSAIKKIRITLQNFVLGQFYEQYGQIIFYACLDIMSYSDEGLASLSITIGICCICAGIPMIFLSFWIVRKYQEVKEKRGFDHEEKERRLKFFEEKYKGISLLFEDFNDKSFNQQAFLFYSVLRSCFFNVIVVFLYLFPMVQILIILTLNIFMLVYILFRRPLKSWLELLQQMCFEITVLVVSIGFLIMAIIERTEDKYLGVREKCSDVVIIFNTIYTFLPLAFLGLRAVISGWGFFHFVRGMYLKSKQPVQKKDGYSKALKHTPQLAQPNETITVESSEILHLEESRSTSKLYKVGSTPATEYFKGNDSSLNISRGVEITSFENQNKSFQGSPIGLNSSSSTPSPVPENNLRPHQVKVHPGSRPSRSVNHDYAILSARFYSSPQSTYPHEAFQGGQTNSRGASHQNVENNGKSQFPPNPRISQHQQNFLNVNLAVNHNQGSMGGSHEMNIIPSPQGPIANGMRINRVKRCGGKIKMPT